jgi:hypothetical protein
MFKNTADNLASVSLGEGQNYSNIWCFGSPVSLHPHTKKYLHHPGLARFTVCWRVAAFIPNRRYRDNTNRVGFNQ